MSEIPEGWRKARFGELAFHISDRVDDPKEAGVEVYVGLEHLDPNSLKIKRRGTPDDVNATKLRVKPGQIIFGKRRAYQRKVAVADFEGICSAHAMVLEANPKTIAPGFLPFFMQSDIFFDRAIAISEGSLSPTIKWKTLANQEFLIPPIARQKELVELFQAIEDAIAATEESIAAAEQLKRSLTHNLLSEGIGHTEFKQTHLGKIPKPWRVASLSSIADLQVGFAFKSSCFSDEGTTKLLRGENVGYGCPSWADTKYLPQDLVPKFSEYALWEGDVVIGMDRTFTGQGCKISEIKTCDLPSLLVQRVGRFVAKECDLELMCK